MHPFLFRLGNRLLEVLFLAAVFWGVVIHSIFWALSPTVFFVLLGLAGCIWLALRLFPATVPSQDSVDYSARSDSGLMTMPSLRIPSFWIWAGLLVSMLVVGFQMIPLPLSLVESLSPKRLLVMGALWDAMPELRSETLTLSVNQTASLEILPFVVFALLAFLLGNVVASSRRRVRRLIVILLGFVLIEAFYGVAEQMTGHHYILWVPWGEDLALGTFINRNHFAALLSLFLPVSVGWLYFCAFKAMPTSDRESFLPPSSRQIFSTRQGLWVLVPAVLALGIIQSQSRGGFSTMIFGLTLLFGIGSCSRVTRAFSMLGIVLAFVLFTYTINSDYDRVLDRFNNLAEKTERGRMTTWLNSYEIVRDYPLFGIGAGNFPNVYPQYEKESASTSPQRAHNEWLEGLVVFGYLGMVPLIISLLVCFIESFRVIRRAGKDQPWLLGVWCGLIGLVLHSFMEFNFHAPGILILATFLMGLLLGFGRLCKPQHRHTSSRG